MRNRPAVVTATLFVMAVLSQSAVGQSGPPASTSSSPAKPPVENAGADLSGVWNVISGVYRVASFGKDEPPMTAWGLAQFSAAKPSQGPRGVSLTETNDRVYKCAPPGMPYIYIQLFPVQMIQTPKALIELFEYDHIVRYIYTDGRPHPADLTPTYNGHSIGHWEGDTLVVDTVGLNGKNWLDRLGHPESDQMHIVERIRRVDNKTLQVDFTFDDPKAYQKTWSASVRLGLRPAWDILEHVCEDNLAFESFEK